MSESRCYSTYNPQEIAIIKARCPAQFLTLAPQLSWSSLGLLITKAEKLINFYADRDMFDNITLMIQTVDELQWWWTLRVYQDRDAPIDLRNDALDDIASRKKINKIQGERLPSNGDQKAWIDDGHRTYQPDVSWMA